MRSIDWRGRLKHGPTRGIVTLVSGSAGAQLVTLAAAPILTRLYSPESFGIFSYMVAATAVAVTVSSLKFDAAIPLAPDFSDAQRLTRLSLVASATTALAIGVACVLFQEPLGELAGFGIMPWALWLPILILATAWFGILSQVALRARAYGAVASRTLAQNIGTAAGQLLFAMATRTATGLLAGQLVGRFLGIVSLARSHRDVLARPNSGYGNTIRTYRRFPFVFTASAALNTLGTQLPLILVGACFGIHAAGYLGVAQRIVLAPAALVGIAVGQVFSGELSARLREGQRDTRSIYLRTTRRLVLLATLISGCILVLSPSLFPLALGRQWAEAGGYAQAMALSVGLGFVAGPLSFVFIAYQKTTSSILVDLSRIILIGGLGLTAWRAGWSATEALWMMYLGQFLNYVITWVVGLAIVSNRSGSAFPLANPLAHQDEL